MVEPIELDEYLSRVSGIIYLKGFRQCKECGKISAGISRTNNYEYFYNNEISCCAEHTVFDLILGYSNYIRIYDNNN